MEKATFDPSRFLEAQENVYARVVEELSAGQKRSHWMWFIFPQLAALGRSSAARFYGLEGEADARAFAHHPVLGARLRECSALVLAVNGRTASQILGWPDDLKLRSCMTLFEVAVPGEPVYAAVLRHLYGGAPDELTLACLRDRGRGA
jgi:uncharacterized protein (DUF1810 family)